jgi:hypothetical protein
LIAENTRTDNTRRRLSIRSILIISVSALVVLVTSGLIYLNHPPVIAGPAPRAMPSPNGYDLLVAADKNIIQAKEVTRQAWCLQYAPYDPRHITMPTHGAVHAIVERNEAALGGTRSALPYSSVAPSDDMLRGSIADHLLSLLALDSYDRAWRGDWDGAMADDLDAMQLDNALGVEMTIRPDWQAKIAGDFAHLSIPAKRRALARFEQIDRARLSYADSLRDLKQSRASGFATSLRNPRWRDAFAKARSYKDFRNPKFTSRWIRVHLTSAQTVVDNWTACIDKCIVVVEQPYALKLPFPPAPSDPVNTFWPDIVMHMWPESLTVEATHNLMLATLALDTYHAEHGAYPVALADLTPSYLAAVPNDPFALRAPLTYRSVGKAYVLYSLGPDSKDDRGAVALTGRELIDNRRGPLPTGDMVAGTTHYFF